MNRARNLARLDERFDVLVIGGGATGLGAALDAATRGYRTALLEAGDFGSATSSRSSKLIHGGVRYLARGQIGLVREALRERAILRRNAAHLVWDLQLVVPAFGRFAGFDLAYYAFGLRLYDWLAGSENIGSSQVLSASQTQRAIPGISTDGLGGGVSYHDGQFDDARLALALACTADAAGAAIINYVRVHRLLYEAGRVSGAVACDAESGSEISVRAKAVINATGVFADELRRIDDPAVFPLVQPSRGTHLIFPAAVLGGSCALLVPRTDDGRVVFAMPWLGRVLVGTTDLAADSACEQPVPTEGEIDYLITHVNRYLRTDVGRRDVLSTFAGLRPLLQGRQVRTADRSRGHLIDVSPTAVVTVTGGKWTTYRRMAEDAVDAAVAHAGLTAAASCTATTRLDTPEQARGNELRALVDADPLLSGLLDKRLPYTQADVLYAARNEMARSVDDVLSRRTRSLFLDARAALAAAPNAAAILAGELGQPRSWQNQQIAAFSAIAQHALVNPL